ncbi:hypothetical protein Tco_0379106 [Tanacetum coccineum]
MGISYKIMEELKGIVKLRFFRLVTMILQWLKDGEDKQPEEKTNTDCLVKEQEKEYQDWVERSRRLVCPRIMGFNESGEYKKTFIGSGVGTGSMQVLQGDEFEVEPQEGHTFEGATLCMGTIQYREDSNEPAFAVAAVEKIYAHESLTLNNTVACEKCSDDSDGYYWESTPVGSQEYQMVCTRLDIASQMINHKVRFMIQGCAEAEKL